MKKLIIGSTYTSKNYGKFKILKHIKKSKYLIKFNDTGWETQVTASNITKGKVKDYQKKTTYGAGFLGEKPDAKNKQIRKEWHDLIKRSYSTKFKAKFTTYKDVSIHQDWLDFRIFKKWYKANYIPGWQLDKDLLVPGNKHYSPKTCVYLPQDLNKAIMSVQVDPIRKDLGVTKRKDKYVSSIKANGEVKHLGTFDTEEEAHKTYMVKKIEQLESITKLHKKALSPLAKVGIKKLIKRLRKEI